MKNKLSLFLFSFGLMLLFGSVENILACSCNRTAPCEQFGNSDVSFVGKVIGSKRQITVNDYGADVNRKVTYDVGEIYFEVTESFAGVEKGSRITIHSNESGAACGVWFKRGETYVVFASRESKNTDSAISSLTFGGSSERLKADGNRLWTTLCSGTREIEGAKDTLNYLRNLPPKGSGGTIVGRIDERIRDYTNENRTSKPMSGTKIQAQSVEDKSRVFYGTSNQTGYFEIKVPVGNYLVTPLLDANLTFANSYEKENKPLKIEDQKCDSKIFWISNDSELKGKVVDADGKPYGDVVMELIPFDNQKNKRLDYERETVSDDGTFSFKGVRLGKYILSVNFTDKPDDDSPFPTTFYPKTDVQTRAEIFEINYGTKIKDIVFQLPPKLVKREIKGTVVWKNGKPAVGAEVQLVDVDADRDAIFKPSITDAKGEFAMNWFAGRKYKLKVIVWKKSLDGQSGYGIGDAETGEFVLDDKTQAFRIVLNAINSDERSVTRRTVRVN